jgi:hypothetical protein
MIILQLAVTSLIAHRTIKWMVREDELKDRRLTIGHPFVGFLRKNLHPFCGTRVAPNREPWSTLYLNLTHPTVSCDRKIRMITVMGNLFTEELCGLNYIGAFANPYRNAIYRYVH